MQSNLRYPKVNGYRLIQQVGGGGFSTVFQAVNTQDHRVAACKVVALTLKTTQAGRKAIDKEMRVHAALKHKNVLEFLSAVVVESGTESPYIPAIYMLLEFAAGGDLFDKIAPDVGVGEDVAHFYFLQLLSGLTYIHTEGVCHRDLKPENLLLNAAGTLKISDFGLCSVYKLKESGRTRMLSERCGSLPYVAPELNSDMPYAAEPIDAWGVGVILFTMVVGNTPWDEPTGRSYEFSRYVSGAFIDDAPWDRIPAPVFSLIIGLLTISPQDRMTLADALQHPWALTQSQLASQGPVALAEKLTQSLRNTGDLDLVEIDMLPRESPSPRDDDQIMLSATIGSQFTQSLMLFSQTQGGTRYTPHLTRFWASIAPPELIVAMERALQGQSVRVVRAGNGPNGEVRCRIGALDARRIPFKGWAIAEPFATADGGVRSFCVMQRDEGDPISWRRMFKAAVQSQELAPYVLRRRVRGS
ncbi:CAMK/CAMKL/CHK1 protein kinase [Multifurca ochricompacta]|uniref:non-specific serine/threonine protein kinase n=1 Tax=Multifurca ochricompacta TaxID=376703 RepID=A0AAD4M2Z6_9AGAM|nr:CAMK/CAMKL/CHK1 protein kinase [Multifurca ochricompacta]